MKREISSILIIGLILFLISCIVVLIWTFAGPFCERIWRKFTGSWGKRDIADPTQPQSPVETNKTAGQKFCFACGETIDARAEICPRCGVRQQEPRQILQNRKPLPAELTADSPEIVAAGSKKIFAGLLAFLLGGLGIHKFYLGYKTAGCITLFLSFFFFVYFLLWVLWEPDYYFWAVNLIWIVFVILIAIEGIIYLTKSNEQFYEDYILNEKQWF